MAFVPGLNKIINKFKQELKGSFGRFKTNDSFKLQYLMTSVPINEIDSLSTASELFRLEVIDFEELIQRDIDYSRVQKIANEYLSCGKERVVFFPPLLACIVLVEDSGNIKRKYSKVDKKITQDGPMEVLRSTWDEDGFELDLPIGDKDSCTRYIDFEGQKQYFYEFAASLKLNPQRAKLVVLDGQHRLEAMKLLRKNPEQKEILENLEIPICLAWAPDAIEGNTNDEDMMKDFRELFVRINLEPKKVSGHFITLLKDDSYSAMAVRQLANFWKKSEFPRGASKLHLLEWNTREDERVDLRTRGDFSVTTVSIISKALESHMFKTGIAPDLLNLEQEEAQFEMIDPDFSWNGIVDKTHGAAIDSIIKKQIDKILVPALDTLFREAAPYNRLEKVIGEAFGKLQLKVDENNGSFVSLKSHLNDYIYNEVEMFEASTRTAYIDFKKWISISSTDRVFFYAVFQQALIRFWLNIATLLKPFNLNASQSAFISLVALDALSFKQEVNYFSIEHKYTRSMLWKNENINFGTSWAKNAWTDLLGTSLLNVRVLDAIRINLQKEYELDDISLIEVKNRLLETAKDHLNRYLQKYKEEIRKDTRASLDEFFSEEKANQLRSWKVSPHEVERKNFETTINERAEIRYQEGMIDLANILSVSTDELQRMINAG